MKSNYTHIPIVLDRSGSMQGTKSDTIGGVNHFIEIQRKTPGECTVTLVQFDDVIEDVFTNKPVAQVPDLTNETYVPRNSTALLDAIGQTIIQTGDWLNAKPESERPEKVIFVIITDGLENASRVFKRERIFDMIKHQREVYKWEFVFLGANQDAIQEGTRLGNVRGNTMTYDNSSAGISSAYASVAVNARMFRSGAKMDMSFEKKQRDEQEELLKKKKKK